MIGNNNRIGEDLHDLKKYGIICHDVHAAIKFDII